MHPAPDTALAAALQRWRRRLSRTALVLLGVCLAIAALLLALDGGRFRIKLTYSLSIGLCCTAINDLAWFAQAWGYDKLRSLRRLPPSPGPFATGWAGVVPSALLCVLLGPPLGQALGDSVLGLNSPSLMDYSSAKARVTLVVSVLATLVLLLLLSAAERLATARAEAEAARRQAAENQLRLLQSQLEPHMLFNTLANLRVLIAMDPVQAQAMLDRLIAFLRGTLSASRTPRHALATEFERIGDYLALMGVRMGPRLAVELELPAELREVQVPPLVLQPLVENSIQHGLEPKVAGGRIRVSAQREASARGPMLLLQVRDTGVGPDSAQARPGTGFGLAGIRERLATLYGKQAGLELVAVDPALDAEGGMLATLRLPLQTSASAASSTFSA